MVSFSYGQWSLQQQGIQCLYHTHDTYNHETTSKCDGMINQQVKINERNVATMKATDNDNNGQQTKQMTWMSKMTKQSTMRNKPTMIRTKTSYNQQKRRPMRQGS